MIEMMTKILVIFKMMIMSTIKDTFMEVEAKVAKCRIQNSIRI